MILRLATCGALLVALAGCGPDYSPDTYSSNAVQQANKVEQGVVVGVRDVAVSASGATGAVVGGAAGGIAGAQVGAGAGSAFGALGGSLIGGLAGNAAEHATGDTRAFEYIVRKGNGDLVSVTQKDTTPLALGQKVLVIAGNQARVVPDYTVSSTPGAKEKADGKDKPAGGAKPGDATASADGAKPDGAKPADAAASTDGTKPAEAAQSSDGTKPADTAAPAAPAPATSGNAATPTNAGGSSGASNTSGSGAATSSNGAATSGNGAASTAASVPPSSAAGGPIRLTDPLPAPTPASAAQPAAGP
ncbi:MAG: hypothetical protein P4L71_03270 [Acetobacteraceae bacterium]|nr:hypothetical protein [Acetobacteraceae bacterium]